MALRYACDCCGDGVSRADIVHEDDRHWCARCAVRDDREVCAREYDLSVAFAYATAMEDDDDE